MSTQSQDLIKDMPSSIMASDTPMSDPLSVRLLSVKIPQTKVVLSAVQDTLREQKTEPTPTAYFSVVLALLSQSISTTSGNVNKDLATSVVYLLDVVTPYVPPALLRSKFSQILSHLSLALTHPEADAPLLRPAIGCLESLLVAQDAAAWALPPNQAGPRRAVAALLNLALDHRPKVRKRAQEALTKLLTHAPPTPSLDHPAADLCAETSLIRLRDLASEAGKTRQNRGQGQPSHEPALIHALQLVKTLAAASGGWPSRNIEPLCELLLDISRSSHEYLIMATFEVFEAIFAGMTDELSSAKLPRLIQVISELRPSENDSHLLPPWVAILTRAYDVSAHVDPQEAFQKLPEVFRLLCGFLASPSYNIRESASEGLVSLLENCIPDLAPWEPAKYDEKTFKAVAEAANELLTVKYQAAWMEVFKVLCVMFDAFQARSDPLLSDIVKIVGELRGTDAFQGKKEADAVIGKAVAAMGPESVLRILPLNLTASKPGQPGRAWMLPILRDHVSNTTLAHFRSEFVPLSAAIFQRIIDKADGSQTMESKIFETVVQQIWAIFPGYCDLPRDLRQAFDQSFAEQIANILYKQVDLRTDVCKALQTLVESNRSLLALEDDAEELAVRSGISKVEAQTNLDHLATFAGNILAVLFNVYSETLPQYRGYILTCINAYLSITSQGELNSTFSKVIALFNTSLVDAGTEPQAEKTKPKNDASKPPPMSHTFMTLIITMAPHLPRESYVTLFDVASTLVQRGEDPQLQKRAYKLVSRLAESEIGRTALSERSSELGELMLRSSDKVPTPAKRDRLAAIACLIEYIPSSDLHLIPAVLSEVIISLKEVNEKARAAAFELLVGMGERMKQGGTVVNSRVPKMRSDAPDVEASLEEYFKMVSAGLADESAHMVSATVTALSRLLFEFREALSEKIIGDLVTTLDLFLTSKNREVVRSVLGFVKVCVISLPISLIQPRLPTLVPNLIVWSHEHKARFKAKVKHILERMIRRFGVETVAKYCPQEDQKLIVNIRKTRERRKRKKDADAGEDAAPDEDEADGKGRAKFESEYDEAIYGSEDSDTSSEDDEVLGRKRSQKKNAATTSGRTFIIEDEDDDPIDLLDPKALAKISSTRPRFAQGAGDRKKLKARTDVDGKLLLGTKNAGSGNADDDTMVLDDGAPAKDGRGSQVDAGAGVNAYVEALKGKDAVQRGQRGRLKFSNRRRKDDEDMHDDHEDEAVDGDKMEIDDGPIAASRQSGRGRGRGTGPARIRAGRGQGRGGRGGIQAVKNQRRGLGAMLTGDKTRDAGSSDGMRGGKMSGRGFRGIARGRGGRVGGGRIQKKTSTMAAARAGKRAKRRW